MDAVIKIVSFVIFLSSVSGENCINSVDIVLYNDISSDPKNSTITGTIRYGEDVFHMLIGNQTIEKLCPNSVVIENELSVLQIVNSSIKELLPGAFNITPQLALLKITHNPIHTIKKGVFNTINVKELDLSNNHISLIEKEAFENNTHLQIIKLNYNALKEFEPNWFVNSPNVYKFSAIYNEIPQLPEDAFRYFSKQRPLKIRLSANLITEVNKNALKSVKAFDVLKLNGNKLKELPDELFSNKTVKYLQLSTNLLRCFPDSLFKTEVTKLEFYENTSFDCACLKKVKKLVDSEKIDVYYPAIICEDRTKEVNLVFNINKTYEIPLILPNLEVPSGNSSTTVTT